MTAAQRKTVAKQIVDELFEHARGHPVLCLVQQTYKPLEGPGWCKEAIVDVIEKHLEEMR